MALLRLRPRFALAALAVAVALLLASCGGGGNGGEEATGGKATPSGPVTVTVWHSMSSLTQAVLQRMADEFNESQSQYVVELVFQGGYSDSLIKLINSSSGNVPSAIQLSDASTQIMIDAVDSGVVVPVQKFVDAEDYDLSDFEPKALSYYTVDDTLYSMPFNLSGPVLYYDRKAFEEAGLDPDQPPSTLAEVEEYSELLVQRNEQGEITRTAIALQVSAWVFEQMLAKNGSVYVDSENGRAGRASEAMFAGDQGKEIIEWWDRMVGQGLAYNAGGDALDAMLKLASGQTTMVIASTAALRGAIAALTLAGRDVARYDVAAMPGPEGAGGGIVLGGASFWLLNDPPEFEQQGAWEFLKFAASPEQQARWHADTGYFPSRISAWDLPAAVEARTEYPQFEAALQQLRAAPDNTVTRGALLGSFNEVRDEVVKAFELVLGGDADPGEALEAAAAAANEIMEDYNRTAP